MSENNFAGWKKQDKKSTHSMISFIYKLLDFYHKVTYSDRADQWLHGAPLVSSDKEGQEGDSKKWY